MMSLQTLAAVASAIAAIVAAAIAVFAVRRTLWLSAMVALEGRFAQINHAKLTWPDDWISIDAGELSDGAKHLVFETFQFYHQAFLLCRRRAISAADYRYWGKRLEIDLQRYPAYGKWWNEDEREFHNAWDDRFVAEVNRILSKSE